MAKVLGLVFSLSFLHSFFCVSASASEKIILFERGEFAAQYEQQMQGLIRGEIKAGTELVFSKKSFRFKRFLGSGGTTVVISTGDGRALRLAKTAEEPREFDGEEFKVDRVRLKDYVSTGLKLQELGLPVPYVYAAESLQSANSFGLLEYVLVEEVPVEFSFKKFAEAYAFDCSSPVAASTEKKLGEKTCTQLLEQFYDLAEKASALLYLADIHTENLVWSRDRWLFLDFGEELRYFKQGDLVNGQHIFETFFNLPPAIREQLGRRLRNVRTGGKSNGQNDSLLQSKI